MIRNMPGNRASQVSLAAGRYCRAFASIDAMPGTRACRLAVCIRAAPGQLMSPPATNSFSLAATHAIRIMCVNPLGDLTTAPVQPSLLATCNESTSISDSSMTTGQSFAASCMAFSGCAPRSRAVGCSTYWIRSNPLGICSFNRRRNVR